MEQIELGAEANFSIQYYDSDGAYYDPPDVQFDIVKSASTLVSGPYVYSEGQITQASTGRYTIAKTINEYLEPGFYHAKWSAVVPEGTQYSVGVSIDDTDIVAGGGIPGYGDNVLLWVLQPFEIVEHPIVPSQILDPPRLYGKMRIAPQYQTMGLGETDRVFLVGHADGLGLNDPYQVTDMQEAVNILGADTESPLLRAMLEVYNAGCRDIWITVAAPMYEYEPDVSFRESIREDWDENNFYQQYYSRLETTYEMLLSYDYPEIIVPIEAPFYNSGNVDFLTQLCHHCKDAFATTGAVRLGIIGSRIYNWTSDDLIAMAQDSRLTDLREEVDGDGNLIGSGKFVMPIVGEGAFSLPQMPFEYSASLAAVTAGVLSTRPYNRGMTYARLDGVMSLNGRFLTQDELVMLARAGLNCATRTQRGKRGSTFEVVAASDNTLALNGSDYWSVPQIRLVGKVIERVRSLGRRYLGTIGYVQFKKDVEDFLDSLVARDWIRGFKLSIIRNPDDLLAVDVQITLRPYFGVRELYFIVAVGPGA